VVLGLVISTILYRRAIVQWKLAEHRSETIAAMFEFIAHDLIGQANPYLTHPVTVGDTRSLLSAIDSASVKIDRRFSKDLHTSALLHETIADSYKAQTEYVKADAEYRAAERQFLAADGELSSQAAIVEFKRENSELSSRLPGAIEDASRSFAQEEIRLRRFSHAPTDVNAWRSMISASLAGMGSNPKEGVSQLSDAIQEGQTKSMFDPMLLIAMRSRLCGLYVRLADGRQLESCARSLRRDIEMRYGSDSPYLPILDMYLQEALYLQGRFREAILQSDDNLRRFPVVLGPRHELTLAILGNRASSEAQLGRYGDAAADDRKLYQAEQGNPSGVRLAVTALADAAKNDCRSGKLETGMREAQKVMGAGQPALAAASRLFMAECLVSKAEKETVSVRSSDLKAAVLLMDNSHADLANITGSDMHLDALSALIRARMALLENDLTKTKTELGRAERTYASNGADPYEMRIISRLNDQVRP
jgi:tetratricopeptide (TPR) repeat protein